MNETEQDTATQPVDIYDRVLVSPVVSDEPDKKPTAKTATTQAKTSNTPAKTENYEISKTNQVLTILALIAAIGVLGSGLYLAYRGAGPSLIAAIIITIGGCLVVWLSAQLITGDWRQTKHVTMWTVLDLIVVAGFGQAAGYGIKALFRPYLEPSYIVLGCCGLLGVIFALIIFVREALQWQQRKSAKKAQAKAAQLAVELNEEIQTTARRRAILDEDADGTELVARGQYPLPRRGSAEDLDMWDDTLIFEFGPIDAKPRRAAPED